MSNSLVICIGSNGKDRDWQMNNCINWLKSILTDCQVSLIYNSPALNGNDDDYLNAVMIGKTKDTLEEATAKLKQYETVCGRTPKSKNLGIVPMDLDIIIWNDKILREKDFDHSYFQEGWKQLNDK